MRGIGNDPNRSAGNLVGLAVVPTGAPSKRFGSGRGHASRLEPRVAC